MKKVDVSLEDIAAARDNQITETGGNWRYSERNGHISSFLKNSEAVMNTSKLMTLKTGQ